MAVRNQIANQSTVKDFLLMTFSDEHDLQILHFVIFLSTYFLAAIGNCLVVIAVVLNHHLHTPMYFFLVNLSLTDICVISTTVPKSMAVSLTNSTLISFSGCVTQIFFVVMCVTAELVILAVMAYDRFVAICHPLQYKLIMNWDACAQMAAATWISSVLHAVLQTGVTFRLSFCGSNIIEQFFCDIPQLQKISCTDTNVNEQLILILGLIVDSFMFIFIFVSYGYIFSTVLKIPSVQGRHKAFSTCTPHLAVFSLFITTGVLSYMRPKSLSSPTLDMISAVFYTVLPPILNPIIYSLRNKDIQEGMWKIPLQIKKLLA
ncbi:olfactory receptor 14A16-like [Paroedura picta]|uniref:olfactory receptor 14A16-like n=1 Tax=Paroedura picta TaxID=143630 RepID=UPI004056A374